VLGMGFQRALIAMIIGNLIMFAYVGALGALGTKKGMNFALIASIVFGRKGYVFSSGLLSTLLLGWYAVQTGITGNLISSTYHLNSMLVSCGVRDCSPTNALFCIPGLVSGNGDWRAKLKHRHRA
jgi:cytosine permease